LGLGDGPVRGEPARSDEAAKSASRFWRERQRRQWREDSFLRTTPSVVFQKRNSTEGVAAAFAAHFCLLSLSARICTSSAVSGRLSVQPISQADPAREQCATRATARRARPAS